MTEKRPRENARSHEVASPTDEQPALADAPILMLCLIHQMLLNFRRIEPSIRRTIEGDYAIVIPHVAVDWCYLLAIVPTETGLVIDAIEVDSPDDEFSVSERPETGLGLAQMLDLALHAAADMGNQPACNFGETVEALRRQKDPRLSRIQKFLRGWGLSLGDVRNALTEAIRS